MGSKVDALIILSTAISVITKGPDVLDAAGRMISDWRDGERAVNQPADLENQLVVDDGQLGVFELPSDQFFVDITGNRKRGATLLNQEFVPVEKICAAGVPMITSIHDPAARPGGLSFDGTLEIKGCNISDMFVADDGTLKRVPSSNISKSKDKPWTETTRHVGVWTTDLTIANRDHENPGINRLNIRVKLTRNLVQDPPTAWELRSSGRGFYDMRAQESVISQSTPRR